MSETKESKHPHLRHSRLPWIAGAAAAVVYLATMSHWLTLASLTMVGKVAGWYWWVANLGSPLTYLFTLPFKALPATSLPIALNALSAVLAGLTLAQLARSAILLPQDRTREQRQRESNPQGLLSLSGRWIPPIVAVGLLAFQMTFWEHATSFTGEMFDLFVFAFVIRCVLEHRIAEHSRWLTAALLVYGVGMANNWAMIGFLPLFVITVVVLEQKSLFRLRRLFTVAGLGAAGFLLYFLLPSINHFGGAAQETWYEMFRYQFVVQKSQLLGFPKYVVVILALTSLFPLLLASVKWPANAGDTNPLSQGVAGVVLHFVHLMFLGLCVWVFFDPFISPREVGKGLPFLTFYYLSALCAAYLAGYFIVVCSNVNEKKWQKASPLLKGVRTVMTFAVGIAAVVAPAWLAWFNAPRISAHNSPVFRQYAERIAASLPEEPSVILSSQPELIVMTEAALAAARPDHDHLFVDARYLSLTHYHERMRRRKPERWPADWSEKSFPHGIPPAVPSFMTGALAQTTRLAILHPVSGQVWLEGFRLDQQGLNYRVVPRSTDSITPKPPTPAELDALRAQWSDLKPLLEALAALTDSETPQASFAARQCSTHLVFHGVQLRRAGDYEGATAAFDQALRLNPENYSAQVNAAHAKPGSGEPASDFDMKTWQEAVSEQSGNWDYQTTRNGPVDAPSLVHEQGLYYLGRKLFRQSAILLLRAQELDPDNIDYRLAVAEMYLRANVPDKVFQEVAAIRKMVATDQPKPGQAETLLRLEAMAHHEKNDFAKAESMLKAGLAKNAEAAGLQRALSNLYIVHEKKDEAMDSLKAQLDLNPDDRHALLNLGALLIKQDRHEDALKHFDKLVRLTPNDPAARLNRAIAYSGLNRLAEATRDLERIRSLAPQNATAAYYLADLTLKQGNKEGAREHLVEFLSLAPPQAAEARTAAELLDKLNAELGD